MIDRHGAWLLAGAAPVFTAIHEVLPPVAQEILLLNLYLQTRNPAHLPLAGLSEYMESIPVGIA